MSMQPGCVTVMMPAYNAERYIVEAIESVLAQSYANWELIVVDDGSGDGTAQKASQFADARIKVIRQANGGEAAARNTALAHGRGEYVAFLDSDDVFLPHHLEVAVVYLRAHKAWGGVYSDGYYCNEHGTRLQTLSSRRRGPFEGDIFEAVVRGPDVFGPPVCVVLRRGAIVDHDLRFDRGIVIGPDWDFFIRYAAVAEFGHLDQVTCLYRVHRANVTARVDLPKRALEMAKCRKNAIRLKRFQSCSLDTRAAVFYDLLVNLLRKHPDQQAEIVRWEEFDALPSGERARLLRLMASKALVYDGDHGYVGQWLRRARAADRADWRGAALFAAYSVSPALCRWLLRARTVRQVDPLTIAPFADLRTVNGDVPPGHTSQSPSA
jgi:glycosyltransferase involved in cell wall biosynthesis